MEGLTKVKRLGDEAVTFDPTKYSALAWGVLTFGVEAAVRHHRVRKQALDSAELVSHLLVQYAAFERRYRDGSDITRNFEHELLAAYKATLHYCASVQGYLAKYIPSTTTLSNSLPASLSPRPIQRIAQLLGFQKANTF